MRDTIKTNPPDPVRHPMDDRPRKSAMGRWLWIAAVVLLGLVLAFWFAGMGDDTADIDATPSAAIPADEAIADPEVEVIEVQPETGAEPATEAEVETDTEVVPSTPPE